MQIFKKWFCKKAVPLDPVLDDLEEGQCMKLLARIKARYPIGFEFEYLGINMKVVDYSDYQSLKSQSFVQFPRMYCEFVKDGDFKIYKHDYPMFPYLLSLDEQKYEGKPKYDFNRYTKYREALIEIEKVIENKTLATTRLLQIKKILARIGETR
jgi:hypothetical protein